jgi:hypothetical protein
MKSSSKMSLTTWKTRYTQIGERREATLKLMDEIESQFKQRADLKK